MENIGYNNNHVKLIHLPEKERRRILLNELYCSIIFENYELNYYLVETKYMNSYGVGISSSKNGNVKSSFCYNITKARDEAIELIEFLSKTSTFPTTLNNMIEDWFYDKV